MTIGASGVALIACELFARLLFPAPPDPTREPQIVYRVDPEIRYVLAPNQHGWVDDGFVTTNSLGFRGNEIASPKPAGRYRVVVLGDSVAFGWGVNDGDTFCAQAEQLLRRHEKYRNAEVVNLAVPGYAVRQEVALLKRALAQLQPDLVLIGFYSNDLPDTFEDKNAGASGTSIAASPTQAGQTLRMNPVPSSWLERLARRSRAVYTGGHALKQLIRRGEGKPGSSMELDLLENRSSPQLDVAWQRIQAQFADLRETSATAGFVVGIVILPPREQVLGMFADSMYQRKARALAEQFGFFVVDPLPALTKSYATKRSLFIPYDRNHPSAAGHRIIAETIANYLDGHAEAARLSASAAKPVS